MEKQLHVYFLGGVQGVGFRFTAERIADELAVRGWVKNLPDGSVEVVAEAEESVLQAFLEKMQQTFSRYIRDADVQWLQATGAFEDFRVRF